MGRFVHALIGMEIAPFFLPFINGLNHFGHRRRIVGLREVPGSAFGVREGQSHEQRGL